MFVVAAITAVILLVTLGHRADQAESTLTTTYPTQNISFKKFGLKISRLKISVPVVPDVDGANESVYDEALQEGVAHFRGTLYPGDGGNIFIFGHSSALDNGKYGQVFANLNDLNKGDEVELSYNDKAFHYTVQNKKIVEATELSVLQNTPSEQLTLMTCWPVGTDQKRLVVIATVAED